MNDVKRVSACISMEGIYNQLIPIIHRIFIFIYTTTNIFITIIIQSICHRRRQRRIRTICRFGLFLLTTFPLVPVKSSLLFFLFAKLHHETIQKIRTLWTEFYSSSSPWAIAAGGCVALCVIVPKSIDNVISNNNIGILYGSVANNLFLFMCTINSIVVFEM